MPEELKNVGEEYQRLSKEGFDAAARSFGEMNKGFQTLAAEMTNYSKRTFEDGFRALLLAQEQHAAGRRASRVVRRPSSEDILRRMLSRHQN